MAKIKADPSFAKAQAAYKAPAVSTPAAPTETPTFSASVTPVGQQKTEGVPTTPVSQPSETPVAPVTTPSVPTQPVASKDASIGQKTPINAVPSAAPNVEKTTTTTPQGSTVVQKETPAVVVPDYNVGKGREAEIVTHLNDSAKDPSVANLLASGNESAFKAQFGYATADETKKDLIDKFYQAKQPQNSLAYFQHLANG